MGRAVRIAAIVVAAALVTSNLAAVAVICGVRWLYARRTLARWTRALQDTGWRVKRHNRLFDYWVDADNGRFRLRVRRGLRLGWPPTVNSVELEGPELPATLTAEAAEEGLFAAGAGPEGVTGDAWFDGRVRVAGDEEEVLAHLDRAGRAALDRLSRTFGVHLGPHRLTLAKAGETVDPRELVRRVEDVVEAADALTLQGRTRSRALGINAVGDPNAEVRLRNLRLLVARYPAAPETRHACEQSLTSPDRPARLEAALALGEAGLEGLAALVDDAEATVAVRVRALQALARRAEEARCAGVVERALDSPEPELVRAAISEVVRLGWAGLSARLALLRPSDPSTALALARALGLFPSSGGEQALIGLLTGRDNAVRVAAIESLGAVGSLAAMERLEPLTRGLFTSSELKGAAGLAMERIRARLGGGTEGALSLAVPDGLMGAVSLLPDAGALSLLPDPAPVSPVSSGSPSPSVEAEAEEPPELETGDWEPG